MSSIVDHPKILLICPIGEYYQFGGDEMCQGSAISFPLEQMLFFLFSIRLHREI